MSGTDDRDERAKKAQEDSERQRQAADRTKQERERVSGHSHDLIRRGNVEAARRVGGLLPSDPGVPRTPDLGELEARKEALQKQMEDSGALPAKEHFSSALSLIDLAAPAAEGQLRDLRLQIQQAGVRDAGPLLFRATTDFDTNDIQGALQHLETLCALRRRAR